MMVEVFCKQGHTAAHNWEMDVPVVHHAQRALDELRVWVW